MNSFQLIIILSLSLCIFIYELYLIKLSDFTDTMIYVKLDLEAGNTAHSYHLHFYILMSNIYIYISIYIINFGKINL